MQLRTKRQSDVMSLDSETTLTCTRLRQGESAAVGNFKMHTAGRNWSCDPVEARQEVKQGER